MSKVPEGLILQELFRRAREESRLQSDVVLEALPDLIRRIYGHTARWQNERPSCPLLADLAAVAADLREAERIVAWLETVVSTAAADADSAKKRGGTH